MKITALLLTTIFLYLFAAVHSADYYVKDIEPIPSVCTDSVCNIYCHSYSACSNYTFTCNQPGQKCSVIANATTSALLFNLNCLNGAECDIQCIGNSSCQTISFECDGEGTKCTHACIGLNSCSNNDFICSDPSECHSSCTGQCRENPLVPTIYNKFYSSLKQTLKDYGIKVENRAITASGDLQLLVEGYEPGSADEISLVLKEAAANFTEPDLQGLSSYEVFERHPRVLEIDLAENKFWSESLRNYLSRYASPYGMTVKSANVSFSTQEMNITCVLSKPAFVPTSLIEAATTEIILEGIADSFGVPPEKVSITWSTPDSTSARLDVTVETGCELPQPFYGTFCGDKNWISVGNATLYLSDLISSPASPLIHAGRFTVKNQLYIENTPVAISDDVNIESTSIVTVSGSSLTTSNSLNIKGSLVITSSSVTTQESINLNNGVLLMDLNQPIKAYGCLNINDNSTITVNSDTATHGVEYELISYACVTGEEKLNVKTSNGACYNTRFSALSLLITFNPCGTTGGPNPPPPTGPNTPPPTGPNTPPVPNTPTTGPNTPTTGPNAPVPNTPTNSPTNPNVPHDPNQNGTTGTSEPNGSESDMSSNGGLPVYVIPIIVVFVVIVVVLVGAYVWITRIKKIKSIEKLFSQKP